MSRRKYKKKIQEQSATVIKPDVKVNVEIDYDKLAEAIVKAEKKAEEDENKKIKSVLWLQRKGSSLFYRILSGIGFAIAIVFAFTTIKEAINMSWGNFSDVSTNICVLIIAFLGLLIILLISGMLYLSSEQIDKVKDKQMLMSLSSGLIGFIALIAAIVAIFVK